MIPVEVQFTHITTLYARLSMFLDLGLCQAFWDRRYGVETGVCYAVQYIINRLQ